MKGSLKIVTVTFSADVYQRFRLLRVMRHFYNFRVRYVGLNQIRTEYESGRIVVKLWLHDHLISGSEEDESAEWFY